ncbi:hypothetical protein ALC62_04345 [Cyphomyrmex costatus]|uniref:Uncharacterized protein n=1 Tax=Cyphomyrmex costatus TaxID=456900 RepID=A0A151IKD1_9HYME|nr:hypothetical protein ALC62_04345 [Cyphomyrmex costatus]
MFGFQVSANRMLSNQIEIESIEIGFPLIIGRSMVTSFPPNREHARLSSSRLYSDPRFTDTANRIGAKYDRIIELSSLRYLTPFGIFHGLSRWKFFRQESDSFPQLSVIPPGRQTPASSLHENVFVDFYRGLGDGGIEFAVEQDGSSGPERDTASLCQYQSSRSIVLVAQSCIDIAASTRPVNQFAAAMNQKQARLVRAHCRHLSFVIYVYDDNESNQGRAKDSDLLGPQGAPLRLHGLISELCTPGPRQTVRERPSPSNGEPRSNYVGETRAPLFYVSSVARNGILWINHPQRSLPSQDFLDNPNAGGSRLHPRQLLQSDSGSLLKLHSESSSKRSESSKEKRSFSSHSIRCPPAVLPPARPPPPPPPPPLPEDRARLPASFNYRANQHTRKYERVLDGYLSPCPPRRISSARSCNDVDFTGS